jgi:hypothetical protein
MPDWLNGAGPWISNFFASWDIIEFVMCEYFCIFDPFGGFSLQGAQQ